MTKKSISFMSGQQGQVALYEWARPQPKYLVLLVHSDGEHLGRYQYVDDDLTSLVACVFGPEHQGHSSGERVFIEDFDSVVDDLQQVAGHCRQQIYPTKYRIIHQTLGEKKRS